jgi:hypothetical protein
MVLRIRLKLLDLLLRVLENKGSDFEMNVNKDLSERLRIAKIDMIYHRKQMEYFEEVIKIIEKQMRRK